MSARSGAATRVWTGRKVFLAFVAFFAVVIAVNGIFVVLSLDSFPGVETEDAYRKGIAYDRVLDADAAQRALGWRVEAAWRTAGPARGRIVAQARDRNGSLITGLAASVILRRPVRADEDRSVTLNEDSPGVYGAEITLPGAGNWEAEVRLGPEFILRQRIIVP
jgi:nitrogen fixation protein FixH